MNSDFFSVAFPSLAFSNTLFFSSAYNVQLIPGDKEPEEQLIRRFRRRFGRWVLFKSASGGGSLSPRRRRGRGRPERRRRETGKAEKGGVNCEGIWCSHFNVDILYAWPSCTGETIITYFAHLGVGNSF
ncbi:UNVERIFIED_CONTAM: 30S ribosomal protein S21, chloroplastic [Sesamum latifolium]|uniref:30S ribosomal protein S21, chloroplastic n=1 Tax=Sesamum latifolium TaxID=2727402 RepID=A0AAW2YEB7_9LAMI